MQAQASPFQVQQIQNITHIGIDPAFIKINNIHLQSERYISVLDTDQNHNPQISIVELLNESNVLHRPGENVQGCMMHPKQNIMVLKTRSEGGPGHILEIVNMDDESKITACQFPEGIVFWKWAADGDILAVVTPSKVFHLPIDTPEPKEEKAFQRAGDNKEALIFGYELSYDRKWGALYGISSQNAGKTMDGHIQLYLFEAGKQQILQGHSCTFGQAYLHNNTHKSSIFCFVERRKGEQVANVHIVQISPAPEGNPKFKKKQPIIFDPLFPHDFAIYLMVSERHGLLYIVTKMGFIYIYEITTCQLIYKLRVSHKSLLLVSRNYTNDGILILSKSGSLYSGVIDDNSLLPHILHSCKHILDPKTLVLEMAYRYSLPIPQELVAPQESYDNSLAPKNKEHSPFKGFDTSEEELYAENQQLKAKNLQLEWQNKILKDQLQLVMQNLSSQLNDLQQCDYLKPHQP